ncbi:C-methyltransferase CouO [Rubripirellula tenax]|uniref:C-methyltransferase CouO n=1 Tax=Rubripirellula tenax TaxID=2528015 RepID=A0A5C6FED6_9BACT|nr:class I SAM-dependent methyltransferase [Rubripirellula tenax]TWU59122.1 C-methyltransferase CouO [Rubripirellula tenax]
MPTFRVPEPSPVNARDEAIEYHDMDHRSVNQQFVDDFLGRAGGVVQAAAIHQTAAVFSSGPRVIDLGCGPAEIPILLCQSHPNVQVMAIDNEVEMLEIAKMEIDIAGMLDRIMLQHADVAKMDAYDDGMADGVISNSVLHHLDVPEQGLVTAMRLVRPGGCVFLRDLFRPDTEAEIEALVKVHSAGQSPAAEQLLRQSFWAALSMEEVREMTQGLGIEDPCVQITSDRHWTLDWSKPGSVPVAST